jgi:hypothetical protein
MKTTTGNGPLPSAGRYRSSRLADDALAYATFVHVRVVGAGVGEGVWAVDVGDEGEVGLRPQAQRLQVTDRLIAPIQLTSRGMMTLSPRVKEFFTWDTDLGHGPTMAQRPARCHVKAC